MSPAALIWTLAQDSMAGTARILARHGAVTAAACLGLLTLGFWGDRPLALWLYSLPAGDKAFFAAIDEVGRSGWMFASAAAVLAWALWRRRRDWVVRAGFVIGAVAMGGWLINVIKILVARARPRLLVADGTYGVHFFEISADWNSFPSGHSQAIAGFAAALGCLWPRLRPVFMALAVLPAVARAVMLNHYASDVIAGYALGTIVTLALAEACRARGLGPLAVQARA
ncbi:phosphatase PAP2 family protein [Zavarzinia sp.]|uniref:phosphatase PAP2 family protein n=1 Tax=Zavarzinia sp. TaxID=2027920 RepID=UPI0035643921